MNKLYNVIDLCRRGESNPHGSQEPADFESAASTSSATSALNIARKLTLI